MGNSWMQEVFLHTYGMMAARNGHYLFMTSELIL